MTPALLARLESLLAKQARQPAGAPGGTGGQFAPMNPAEVGIAASMGLPTSYSGTQGKTWANRGDTKEMLHVVDNPLRRTSAMTHAEATSVKFSDYASERRKVPIASLRTTQDYILPSDVKRYRGPADHNEWARGRPSVVEHKGRMVVVDGNHRTVAAMLNGDKEIEVDYFTPRLRKQARQPAGVPGGHGGEFAATTLGGIGTVAPAKKAPPTAKVLAAAGVGEWSAAEKDALGFYQGFSYAGMNYVMRMGKGDPDRGAKSPHFRSLMLEEGRERVVRHAKTLSDAMSKVEPIQHEAVVYRSVSSGASLFNPIIGLTNYGVNRRQSHLLHETMTSLDTRLASMVGKTIKDHGFTSTTADEKQAVKWMSRTDPKLRGPDQRVMFRITAPKGSKGLWAEKINPNQKDYVVQKEWIVAPGTRYKITGVGKHASGAHLVEMEIVP